MWVYSFMVLIVTYFETALPFGLWIPKVRKWFMLGGILFHLTISLFLSAIWWFYAMIAAYITFFEPETVLVWLRRRPSLRSIPSLPSIPPVP